MKKIILTIALATAFISLASAQSDEDITKFNSFQNVYKIQANGDISFTRMYENLNADKDELYLRIKNYFTAEYKIKSKSNGIYDAPIIFESDDRKEGLILAQQQHLLLTESAALAFYTTLTFRVDIKDNRCRVIINLKDYDIVDKNFEQKFSYNITKETYPFCSKVKGRLRNKGKMQINAINKCMEYVQNQLNVIGSYLKGGGGAINASKTW